MIFKVSVALHGDKAKESEVVVDIAVQEKSSTFSPVVKLMDRIVTRSTSKVKVEDVKLWLCERKIKSLLRTARFKSKGHAQGEFLRIVRRL